MGRREGRGTRNYGIQETEERKEGRKEGLDEGGKEVGGQELRMGRRGEGGKGYMKDYMNEGRWEGRGER